MSLTSEDILDELESKKNSHASNPCEQVQDVMVAMRKLRRLHDETWPRPCFSSMPCFFTQVRTNIRQDIADLKDEKIAFDGECRLYQQRIFQERQDALERERIKAQKEVDKHEIDVRGQVVEEKQIIRRGMK